MIDDLIAAHAMTDGGAPLYVAAQHGNFVAVRFLCGAGAQQNQAMTAVHTSLYMAMQLGHLGEAGVPATLSRWKIERSMMTAMQCLVVF